MTVEHENVRFLVHTGRLNNRLKNANSSALNFKLHRYRNMQLQ